MNRRETFARTKQMKSKWNGKWKILLELREYDIGG